MKRFTRKNNKAKPQDQFTYRKIKTQTDLSLQSISSQSPPQPQNMSFEEISFQRILQGNSKSYAYFMYKLLNRKIMANLKESFNKIANKLFQKKRYKQNINNISKKLNSMILKLKLYSFNKLKQQKYRYNLRKQGLLILHNCQLGINNKMKAQTLLKLMHKTGSELLQQNILLKAIQLKYNQNNISQQYCKIFQKFLKIPPKNIKLFLKTSQQILQPQLLNLSTQLQSLRINKNTLSTSQIIINILKNYIISFKQLNQKLTLFQNQKISQQKQYGSAQLKEWKKINQNRDKQLKRFDEELKQKADIIVYSGCSLGNLRNLQKIVEYQYKICQGKKQMAYQYNSRSILLKIILSIINKLLINNIQPLKSPSNSALSGSRSQPLPILTSLNKPNIIHEQNSLQQSDIIQQVTSIVNQLLQLMQTESTIQNFKNSQNKKYFIQKFKQKNKNKNKNKNMNINQLSQIGKKCQQIMQKYCQKLCKCYQLQIINNQLNNKFVKQIQKLKQDILNKNKQIQSISSKFQHIKQQLNQSNFKNNSLQQKLQDLTIKNRNVQTELQVKTKQIQKLSTKNKQKNSKIYKMSEQYRRFKTIMDVDAEINRRQRQKSIDQILQKSLSKSRQKIDKKLFQGLKSTKNIDSKSKNISQILKISTQKLQSKHRLERTPKKQPRLQSRFNTTLNKTVKNTQPI